MTAHHKWSLVTGSDFGRANAWSKKRGNPISKQLAARVMYYSQYTLDNPDWLMLYGEKQNACYVGLPCVLIPTLTTKQAREIVRKLNKI